MKKPAKVLSEKEELKLYHDKGILFFAKGSSPEWSFEVDQSKNQIIRFLSSTGMIFTAPFSQPNQDFNSTDYYYNIKTVLGHLRVVMKPKISRIIGDKKTYTYQVIVDVKYEQDLNYQHYEGQGMFVPDFRLDGKWFLQSIKGKIQSKNMQESVHVNINLIQENYTGFNSCNPIAGRFICEGNKKVFVAGTSTLKSCEGMLEAEYTQALLNALFIEVKEKKLILSDAKGELAVFIKK
ncbi:MAG: META domain-containing protein [Bacteroidia bacterium]